MSRLAIHNFFYPAFTVKQSECCFVQSATHKPASHGQTSDVLRLKPILPPILELAPKLALELALAPDQGDKYAFLRKIVCLSGFDQVPSLL